MTHQKHTNGICQCIYSVLLLGRVQLLVGHARLPPWLLMQGFNCERIALLNIMRLVYISPDSKGYAGSVHATWTHVGSLLYVACLSRGVGPRWPPEIPSSHSNSVILQFLTELHLPAVQVFFTLEASAELSAAAVCFLNSLLFKLRTRVYAAKTKVQTEVCLHSGERE